MERSRAPKVDLQLDKGGASLDRLISLVKNKVEEVHVTGSDKNTTDVEQNKDQGLDSVVDINKISFLVHNFLLLFCFNFLR